MGRGGKWRTKNLVFCVKDQLCCATCELFFKIANNKI